MRCVSVCLDEFVLLKLTSDRHEASRGLFATAELLVMWQFPRIIPTLNDTGVGTRSSAIAAIADIPASLTNRAMLVCKVIEVWQDFLSEYVDKKFTYICYRRLIRHE